MAGSQAFDDPGAADPYAGSDGDALAELNAQWARLNPPVRPVRWHRKPQVLLAVIGCAAATLLASTVVLLSAGTAGDSPANAPRIAPTTRDKVPPRATSAAPATPITSAQSTSEQTTATATTTLTDTTSEPVEPIAPAAPSASAPMEADDDSEPGRPRTNVTRSPMSFTPGAPVG